MRGPRDFHHFVDVDDLTPEERLRLERIHDLLVQAGPPPDLPPSLERAPGETAGELVQFPLLPRRRLVTATLVAAALAAAAFGGGYLLGHSKARPESFATARVIQMHGRTAAAVVLVAHRDAVGNWPMELQETGLPALGSRDAYYELWLTRDGKPAEACGQFRAHGKTTTVRFTVPWDFRGIEGWIVTRQAPGQSSPGPTVLTT